MHLHTRNVNTAFRELLEEFGAGLKGYAGAPPVVRRPSRNGPVLMIDEPVTVTYEKPRERVLFNSVRDANPFSLLYEALWMLAGRNDVAPMAYYTKRFSEFSDDGETLNGAYGYRWRNALNPNWSGFTDESMRTPICDGLRLVDQLDLLVAHLEADPASRRSVLQMWNVEDDLLKIGNPNPAYKVDGSAKYVKDGVPTFPPDSSGREGSKDVCCNLSVMFALRLTEAALYAGVSNIERESGEYPYYLDMTVTNRSNDLLWGMLGANYVHFSVLQEYMAARLGVEVGRYHHFTNNLHVYETRPDWKPVELLAEYAPKMMCESCFPNHNVKAYIGQGRCEGCGKESQFLRQKVTDDGWGNYSKPNTVPLVRDPPVFEEELSEIVEGFSGGETMVGAKKEWKEPFFRDVVHPMLYAFRCHKMKASEMAAEWAKQIKADDWRIAAESWLHRRLKKENK